MRARPLLMAAGSNQVAGKLPVARHWHHRVLRRGVAMTRAVAIGQVVQGDKEKPELTDMINTTWVRLSKGARNGCVF
jgi:hypothetical protein